MKRGEVRWYTFHPPDKRRPVLILTRTSAIGFLSSVTVAPITTTVREIPSEVLLTPEEDGVRSLCAANFDNIQTVQKDQLGPLITSLSRSRLADVDQAISFALGVANFRID